NDLQVLGQLVNLDESLRDYDRAITHQQAIVALAPDRANLETLARFYVQLGKTDDAAAIRARLLRETNDPKVRLAGDGRALQEGHPALAASIAGPEWSRRPDDWRFGLRLAEAQFRLNQYEGALATLDAILRLPPGDSYASPASASRPAAPP